MFQSGSTFITILALLLAVTVFGQQPECDIPNDCSVINGAGVCSNYSILGYSDDEERMMQTAVEGLLMSNERLFESLNITSPELTPNPNMECPVTCWLQNFGCKIKAVYHNKGWHLVAYTRTWIQRIVYCWCRVDKRCYKKKVLKSTYRGLCKQRYTYAQVMVWYPTTPNTQGHLVWRWIRMPTGCCCDIFKKEK